MSKTKRILLLILFAFVLIVSTFSLYEEIVGAISYTRFIVESLNHGRFSMRLSIYYRGLNQFEACFFYFCDIIVHIFCIIVTTLFFVSALKNKKPIEILKKLHKKRQQKRLERKAKAKINKKLRLEAKLNKMKEDE